MKKVTMYEANDGTRFDREARCEQYEELCDKVEQAMLILPRYGIDSCNFANGEGYIQHTKSTYSKARNAVLELAKTVSNYDGLQQCIDNHELHLSYPRRYLDGGAMHNPIQKALARLLCIDKNYREYGQPYFANNPHEATGGCLN
jgi:hypothetical protein